jgi:hypothetical protein
VEWELGRLPDRAAEQQDRSREHERDGDASVLGHLVDRGDVGGPRGDREHEDAEHERHIAGPRRDERLVRGVLVRLVLPEVTDQQIGADADELPADQHLEQVVRDDQRQHRAGEQREGGVVPGEAGLVGHVLDRVDVDEQRHGRDDQEHHRGEAVDVHPELDLERAEPHPRQ